MQRLIAHFLEGNKDELPESNTWKTKVNKITKQ